MSRKENITHYHPTNRTSNSTLLNCACLTPASVLKTHTKLFLRTPQTAISQVWVMKTINSSNYPSKSHSNMVLIDLIDWAWVTRSCSQTDPCKKKWLPGQQKLAAVQCVNKSSEDVAVIFRLPEHKSQRPHSSASVSYGHDNAAEVPH